MYLECWRSGAVLAVVIVLVWLTLVRALARPVRDTVMVSKRQEGRVYNIFGQRLAPRHLGSEGAEEIVRERVLAVEHAAEE